jgi:tetratricopeptide (TPR) repeat protein
MLNFPLSALVCAISLSACAAGPKRDAVPPAAYGGNGVLVVAADYAQAPAAGDADESMDDLQRRAAEALGAHGGVANLPSQALTRDLLYKFLLAEIAGQRGNVRLAAKAYLELAQQTRDPRIARRAAEIASFGRMNDLALEATSLWLEVEPDSAQARQSLMGVLAASDRLADAKPHLQKLIAADKARAGTSFMQITGLLAQHPDKAGVYGLMQELAAPYPQLPEAQFAVAQAAASAGKMDAAERSLEQALKLRPDFEPAVVLRAQLMQRESTAKAIDYLSAFLARYPGARDARFMYARLLVADKRIEAARQEFQRIEQGAPNNAEIAVTIGLLSLQLNDLVTAEAEFKRGLQLNYRDPDALRFYLGQVAEEQKRFDEALAWYGQVEAGDQLVPAAARYAYILARQNKVDEARAHLQRVEVQTVQQRVQLTQAEAQVLREAREYQSAFDLLSGALERQPDHPDLLYDYAMAAERLDRLEVVETSLKRLIELKPDHAQAYNALGYTFADRNIRLAEARQYIEKALDLAPEDPFILDSMGWVHYRLGSPAKGLDYLQRAFAQRQDPEIAAHLGEILWVQGQREEAERIWRESLREHPGSEELQAVLKKFLD